MSLAVQLLDGLIDSRNGARLVGGPAIGQEHIEATHGPALLQLGNDIGEIESRVDAEGPARLHERVSVGETLAPFGGAREEIIAAPNARLPQGALHPTIVEFKSSVSETPLDEISLLIGVAERFAEGGLRGLCGFSFIDPFIKLVQKGERLLETKREPRLGVETLLLRLSTYRGRRGGYRRRRRRRH